MKRIFKLLLFSIAVCLFLGNCTTKEKENKNTLHYPSSKPYTRWWWFARTIEKEDIKAQFLYRSAGYNLYTTSGMA
jgi:hypothetical protein